MTFYKWLANSNNKFKPQFQAINLSWIRVNNPNNRFKLWIQIEPSETPLVWVRLSLKNELTLLDWTWFELELNEIKLSWTDFQDQTSSIWIEP